MLTCLTDWRGPGKWTKLLRQRRCDLASIANTWTARPINQDYMKRCLVASAPAYLENNGSGVGGFSGAVRDVCRALGYDKFPDGQRFATWISGSQAMYAVNLNRPGAAEAFAQMFAEWFPWADGWHADYFTSLGWLATAYPWSTTEFWQEWDERLVTIVGAMRAARPDWTIVGQQYHLTPATRVLNGLFLEVYPTGFGMTLEKHDAEKKSLGQNGLESVWIAEIREPLRFSPDDLAKWGAWAAAGGYYVSLGRDATALVGA